VELKALALFQREGVGNILGSTSWKTWASKDGAAWIQRVATTRDLKPGESNDAWRSRGGEWRSKETRWRVRLPEEWWPDAERLAGEHRFFELPEKLPDVHGREYAGDDRPTLLAISQVGIRRKVSKWESDPAPDFDPLYNHLKSLHKQTETAKPEYEMETAKPEREGDDEKDWQPPGFPSSKETP